MPAWTLPLNQVPLINAISILRVFVDQKQVIEVKCLALFVTIFLTGKSW